MLQTELRTVGKTDKNTDFNSVVLAALKVITMPLNLAFSRV